MANWGQTSVDSFNKAQDRSVQIAQAAAELKFKRWAEENKVAVGKSVFTIGDNGLEQIGVIPKGSQVVPPASMMSPSAKADLEVQTAERKNELPTADMKNALKTTQQASSLVDGMIEQSSKLKGGYEGIKEIGKAAINRGKGESANYRLYLSNMPSTAVSVYRAVTGDTRLSDADAQARAYPLMWHPSEDVDTREKKNAFIKNMITAREILLKANKFTTDDKGNAVTDLGAVSAMAGKIAKAKAAGYSQKQIEEFIGAK